MILFLVQVTPHLSGRLRDDVVNGFVDVVVRLGSRGDGVFLDGGVEVRRDQVSLQVEDDIHAADPQSELGESTFGRLHGIIADLTTAPTSSASAAEDAMV